jgi:hypothetical protein
MLTKFPSSLNLPNRSSTVDSPGEVTFTFPLSEFQIVGDILMLSEISPAKNLETLLFLLYKSDS